MCCLTGFVFFFNLEKMQRLNAHFHFRDKSTSISPQKTTTITEMEM